MSQTNVTVPGDGSSGMGAGMIVGLVLAIVILGFIVWYFLLNGNGGGTPSQSTGPLQSILQSLPASS
ncbi:MAG: hypothetical protein ABI978_02435 [Chloroflexota bacterium]|mgnify:CR=1 FL=1